MPAKRKNILDVYREMKKRNPDYLLGFGDSQFFTFFMSDAHRIHEALPDIPIERARTDQLRIHQQQIFNVMRRLQVLGLKVALVARTPIPTGGFTYKIDLRSDDSDPTGGS